VPWKVQELWERVTWTWTASTRDTSCAVNSEHGATGGDITNAGFAGCDPPPEPPHPPTDAATTSINATTTTDLITHHRL